MASSKTSTKLSHLLKDGIFTFVVGPSRERYHVHISVLGNISEPLKYMMTNDKMEESIKKEAVLDNVDPEAFSQLLEFAYTGVCGISEGVSGESAEPHMVDAFTCHSCRSSVRTNRGQESYPCCGTYCLSSYRSCVCIARTSGSHSDMCCIVFGCYEDVRLDRLNLNHLICELRIINGEGKKYPKYNIDQEESQADRLGTDFSARRYGCPNLSLSHELLSERIDRHLTTDSQGSGLFEYAKLYVLADKYMVKNLQAITLHKLHRNLAAYKIHDEAIDEVIDLVLYTYTNTSDGGNILDGTADKLRDLVIAYVVDRASDLLKYESFRAMLAAGGAQTADFMALTFAPPAPKTT